MFPLELNVSVISLILVILTEYLKVQGANKASVCYRTSV